MSIERLLADILGQPASLRRVLERQMGDGLPALEQAARVIREASSVALTGMGSSWYACLPARAQLAAHGVQAVAVESAEWLHFPGQYPQGQVAVLVSRSGETIEIVNLLPKLKAAGIPVIGVFNEADSTLARESDFPVRVGSLPDELAALQTYGGSILVLLLIGACATGEPLDGWARDVLAAASLLEQRLPEMQERSYGWRAFFDGVSCVYVLGRGTSLAAVHEGGLLLNEVAKCPSIAMSTANFRHGPVEVVSPGFRAVVFGSSGPTLALDRTLVEQLERFGGGVQFLKPWSELPERVWPLVEIVPLQLAALRLAEWRDIPRNVFRFATQVTASEDRLG